jgi:hypothetical protein
MPGFAVEGEFELVNDESNLRHSRDFN